MDWRRNDWRQGRIKRGVDGLAGADGASLPIVEASKLLPSRVNTNKSDLERSRKSSKEFHEDPPD